MKAVVLAILFTIFVFGQCAKINKNNVRSYYQKLEKKNNETSSGTCTDCKLIASELKHVIDDRTKLDRIKIALKFLCEYIGGERASECKGIVDNLDVIIHQLGPYLDNPEQFCREIHLCGGHKHPMSSRVIVKIMKFFVRSGQRGNVGDMLCDECVFAATELNSLLHDQKIQQEIKVQLDNICSIVGSLENKCQEAIDKYFPQLIEFLQKIVSNPQELCSQLRVCKSVYMTSLRNFNTVSLQNPVYDRHAQNMARAMRFLQTRTGNNVVCVTCLAGIDALKAEISLNKEATADKASKAICDVLPNEFRDQCSDFGKIYAVSFLTMTLNEYSSQRICNDAGLCSNSSIAQFNMLDENEKSNTVCEACHAFSDFLSFEFRQQPLQRELTEMVKQYLCRKLPGDLANQCLDTADQYVPNIMQRIADQLSGASFCLEAGLCSS